MINFCDKCNKVVKESEIKDLSIAQDSPTHVYTAIHNAYGNQAPGMIGFCAVYTEVICGNIRQPTPEEYLAYVISNEK